VDGLPESGAGADRAGAFISYARKDTVFVRELYALLRDAGDISASLAIA